MAENKKLSDLTRTTSLSGSDEFVVVDKSSTSGVDASSTGRTSKIRFDDLKNQIGSQGQKGQTGDSVKGQKGQTGPQGDSVKGQKGQLGDSVKGQKGEIGVGQKGETGQPGSSGVEGKVNSHILWRGDSSFGLEVGNKSFVKKGSSNWSTGYGYTSVYYNGGCSLTFSALDTKTSFMFGLSSTTGRNNSSRYYNIDYGFYLKNNGTYDLRKSGPQVKTGSTYTKDTVFTITYDNRFVRYYVNGVLKHTESTSANRTFFAYMSIHDVNKWTVMPWSFDPMGSRGADGAKGQAGEPGAAGPNDITNKAITSNATSSWTGNPGTQGKIQYHSNRWYIVADKSSNRIVQFRRDGSDKSYIDNNGKFIGTASVADTASKASDADKLGGVAKSSFLTTANNSSLNSDSRNTRGVTRLYRRDDNSDYNVQTYWAASGLSKHLWRLHGYHGDNSHSGCQVEYADHAGTAKKTTGMPSITNPVNSNLIANGTSSKKSTVDITKYGIAQDSGARWGIFTTNMAGGSWPNHAVWVYSTTNWTAGNSVAANHSDKSQHVTMQYLAPILNGRYCYINNVESSSDAWSTYFMGVV